MDMNKKLLNENNIFLSSEYIINGKIIKKYQNMKTQFDPFINNHLSLTMIKKK
jgi:hypothetical protein